MGKFKDIDVVDAIKAMKTHIENGRMKPFGREWRIVLCMQALSRLVWLDKRYGGFPLCRRIESERC